ncbi:hypothetical protein INT43_001101 [Umbelopsis isabellina]|uniref:Uncharacterized protein n=1 Tax=Mortierella isabellina TaxID=91625 RepID=A0A8H7PJU8_MORIS|nr:hypothetical protein INT43_001101 [Umbelopsis isabellina]
MATVQRSERILRSRNDFLNARLEQETSKSLLNKIVSLKMLGASPTFEKPHRIESVRIIERNTALNERQLTSMSPNSFKKYMLRKAIASYCEDEQEWHKWIRQLRWAYNSVLHETHSFERISESYNGDLGAERRVLLNITMARRRVAKLFEELLQFLRQSRSDTGYEDHAARYLTVLSTTPVSVNHDMEYPGPSQNSGSRND